MKVVRKEYKVFFCLSSYELEETLNRELSAVNWRIEGFARQPGSWSVLASHIVEVEAGQ